MRKLASGVFAAVLAASCLTGCFELTSPEEEAKLVASTPFKDFARLRLVNQSGNSAEELAKENKCPTLLRLRSHKTYQSHSCTGESGKSFQAFSSAQFPNLHVFRPCQAKDKDLYECENYYMTLKIEGDMAFFYEPESTQDKVGTVDDLFRLANLTASDSKVKSKVYTYAIE